MTAIYELPREFESLTDMEDPDTEPLLALMRERLDGYQGDEDDRKGEIERQLLNMGKAIKRLKSDEKVLQEHLDETKGKLASVKSRVERLSSWMLSVATGHDIHKAKNALVSVWTQANPPSWEITDEDKVPAQFKRATVTCPLSMLPPELLELAEVEVSKALIDEHFKATGELVPGAQRITDKRHVRVQ